MASELEKLQCECIRIFSGLTVYCRLDHLYEESGLRTLAKRPRIHRLVLLFKIIHNDAPLHLYGLLPEMVNDNTSRHGRHEMSFKLVHLRLEKARKSFIYLTCEQWNSLTLEARTCPSLSTFKRLINGGAYFIPSLLELPRYPSILYNRLKVGCSALNSDLQHANLIPDSMCRCRLGSETLFHFLYDCPFYDAQRELLMFTLNEIGLVNLSIPILFDCDNHLASETIPLVQRALYHYIISARRFE